MFNDKLHSQYANNFSVQIRKLLDRLNMFPFSQLELNLKLNFELVHHNPSARSCPPNPMLSLENVCPLNLAGAHECGPWLDGSNTEILQVKHRLTLWLQMIVMCKIFYYRSPYQPTISIQSLLGFVEYE